MSDSDDVPVFEWLFILGVAVAHGYEYISFETALFLLVMVIAVEVAEINE